MSPKVAVVLVSHSTLIAQGLAELAGQMAPDVTICAAGGRDDDGLGTSYDRIESAVDTALAAIEGPGKGVLILTDLGSATMTAESVVDMADEAELLALVDAPLVEGAVAAAVRAQVGDGLDEVVAAAREAGAQWAPALGEWTNDVPVPHSGDPVQLDSETLSRHATVADPEGLHARPAALLARLAAEFDAETFVNDADASSVLELMTIGARHGDIVQVRSSGRQAAEALAAVVAYLEGRELSA
ncbi:dihydroxyacetone kinase phosphoryl donor subunit DhaM [Schaalia suimastitidis]|uniref:dihydroxyacetone kinase phosphoryl donor subunit DhaM n=1 Tax=Schaalia suimastitidis TaxID=121163 RepID=UPI00047AEC97|nr:dihydroxyacetone kinase phosphoryl donor subunit DhaM [Schaalia suimastitidis]